MDVILDRGSTPLTSRKKIGALLCAIFFTNYYFFLL